MEYMYRLVNWQLLLLLLSRQWLSKQKKIIKLFKFCKYSNNVIKKAKEFDNSMIITILMSPNKRYSTL